MLIIGGGSAFCKTALFTVCIAGSALASAVLHWSTVRYSAVQPWLNDMQRTASATSGNGKVLYSISSGGRTVHRCFVANVHISSRPCRPRPCPSARHIVV